MTILVTGSAGHLGEALMRTFAAGKRAAIGVDILPSAYTTHVGSVADRDLVRHHMAGIETVLHAATLHKPHVATHSRQDLIDHTDQYLRQVEPYVSHDPQASEQLASAWLWLANLQGNPQTINLHDRAGAAASINQATRLLEKSPVVSTSLMQQVKTSAQQIEAAK